MIWRTTHSSARIDRAFHIQPLSENTLIIYFGQQADAATARRIRRANDAIAHLMGSVLIDTIPSYGSIHLTYDLLATDFSALHKQLSECIASLRPDPVQEAGPKRIEIPVYYGEEVALDLHAVAALADLTAEEVISIHSAQEYTVYAIGFTPGFAYLGNIDERIQAPRKQTPRRKVAAGSLGIADRQTAIYPVESPGGWQILGRTPVDLIDYSKASLTPFQMGDRVKFISVTRDEFLALGGSL